MGSTVQAERHGTSGPEVARRKRRRLAGLLAAGVALALFTGFVAAAVVGAGRQPQTPPLPVSVREALADRARDALEAGASSSLPRGACAVRVLGTEPGHVTEVGDARTVYVWARCASVGTQVLTESSAPVAVRLTAPPTADVPRDGSLNEPDRRRIFPDRLWDAVGDGTRYTELESQLHRRIRERS